MAQLSAWLILIAACAAQVAGAAEPVSFSRDVQPLLAERCFVCHGPDEAEGGLALHESKGAFAETDSGELAIVPGKPDESELIRRLLSTDEDERMPADDDPLTEQEIQLLRDWIASGAEYEKHWAFVAPENRDPPQVNGRDWVVNPIDAFVLAGLEADGLKPAAPAEKLVLARRIYFDVTGLPPTSEELRAFLDDRRADAYERLVDRLLASPRYGEKWARHWLDVVRYAESNSFERDGTKPFVWKYRDYVIRSLNDDKPYDQFVREQLAGDELEEVTPDTIAATGYYRLGTWDDEPADELQSKYDDLDNIVSTTSQAFLGLTVGCARCHDHKIDPVPQTDYYGLLAFFADVTPYALPRAREAKHHSLWDVSDPEDQKLRQVLEKEQADLRKQKLAIEKEVIPKLDAADQNRTEGSERQAVFDEKLHLFVTDAELANYRGLVRQLDEVASRIKKLAPQELILSLAKCEPHSGPTHVMMRGNANVLGEQVEPCFPELFGDEPPQIPVAAAEAHSAGRRRVLAEWITRPENLLTGRVIANRLWQHHFGRGIVRSANNFGQLGTPPTHPELLDWLSFKLIENGWRLKPLHRLMLTSNTYRMSSAAAPESVAADPTNDLFSRFNMRRLTAEELRDTVLYVSGQLNEKHYGPSIYPKLSQEVLATQSRPGDNWHTSKPREAARRSIYIHIKRSLIPPELANFDLPATDSSCEARFNTTQAAQALNLLHGEFLQSHARHLAERVAAETSGEVRDQVGHALRLALQREPDAATIADGLGLVERYRGEHGLDEAESLRQFCLMVLNLNEFVYLD
jgi:mono/diheme cytochrome c family protein